MSKAPSDADALLLQVRTMKWQAASVMSTSPNGREREEAAAVFAMLDALSLQLRGDPGPEIIQAARRRLESLGRMRDHPPRARGAGRP